MTLYEVLNLSADCTQTEIEEAYRARRPVLDGAGLCGRILRSLRLNADVDYAYRILSDPQRRRHYDSAPHDFLEFHPVPIVI